MNPKTNTLIFSTVAIAAILGIFIFFSYNNKKTGPDVVIGKEINIGVVSILGTNLNLEPVLANGAHKGAQAYLKRINDSGGIYNRKINFILKDTISNDPVVTKREAQKMLYENDIFAFMWSYCTIQTETMHDFLRNTGIPLLFPLSGKTSVDSKGTYYIRPSYKDEFLSDIKGFILTRDDKEKMSIVTERQDVCVYNRKYFLQAADSLNKKVNDGFYYNSTYKYPVTDINNSEYSELKKNIAEFKEKKVKTVILMSTLTGAYFLRIAEMMNYHPTYFSPSILNADILLNFRFQNINNFFTTSTFPIPSVSKNLKIINDFETDMRLTGYSGYLSPVMLEGYLGAKLFVETLKKAGPDLTRRKFIETLENTKNLDFGGISFTFSPSENVGNHKIYFYKYTEGKPELVKYD